MLAYPGLKIEDSLATLSGILQSSVQDVLARASTFQFDLSMDLKMSRKVA